MSPRCTLSLADIRRCLDGGVECAAGGCGTADSACVAQPCGALLGTDTLITGAAIDSRQVTTGNIFICIKGERADGHDFAHSAAQAGAAVIIAERDPFAGAENRALLPPVFVVANSIRALWQLAGIHRSACTAKVVGVTGTAGKTSVKEVLAEVLAVRGRTERNHMNLNNQIGLPLSMLNAALDADFWVMEVGISEAGDMDELGDILRPDMALVLNAGEGHTQGLGDKGVAHYKARLLKYIASGGAGFVSADYPELVREAALHAPVLAAKGVALHFFTAAESSTTALCAVRYEGPASAVQGKFRVCMQGDSYVLTAPFRGSLGAENVSAIVCVARTLGLTQEEIQRGLAGAVLPAQRCACEFAGGFTVVDDSYNANPLSAARMLETVSGMAQESAQPLLLVMGEMLELGEGAHRAHIALGEGMAAVHPALIFWKGGNTDAVRQGLQNGAYGGPFYPVGGGQEFSALVEEMDIKHGVILFKGSRGNHLERLVATFRDCVLPSGESDAV